MYAFRPVDGDSIFFLYKISMYYYCAIGTVIVIIIGNVVGWATKKENDPEVNRDFISPVMHWLLEKKEKYYTVEKALHIITESIEKK